jgi:hypothetical protein
MGTGVHPVDKAAWAWWWPLPSGAEVTNEWSCASSPCMS